MTAVAAFFTDTHAAAGQAGIIEDHDKSFLRDLVKIHDFTHAFAAQVHECLGLHQKHSFIANHAVAHEGFVFEFVYFDIIFFRQTINDLEPNVMLGFFILSAGVTQPNDAVKFLPLGFLVSESVKKTHILPPYLKHNERL